MAEHKSDILVIGAGMAGAAIAAHLSEHAQVHILEMEDQPGYHSTGRSAALFSQTYGNETIRALSRASRRFFFEPPEGFCSIPLVKPRPVLVFGLEARREAFERFVEHESASGAFEKVSPAQALALCPVLRRDGLLGGIIDKGTADIEVHELHHGYLRAFKRHGGKLTTGARVGGLVHVKDRWTVQTNIGTFSSEIVVNASGAWAGELGQMALARDIGLQPCRRTAALIETPVGVSAEHWPMILDAEEKFYLKPDAGLLLLSPADETPCTACDAQPEELDVAIAIDRLQQSTTLQVQRVRKKWAGLRSFVKDRSPVVGYDPSQPGFFWLAALGGYGIQTAPALSVLAASLVLGRRISGEFSELDLHVADLSPTRLAEGGGISPLH
jgi:D-arginine dehydrogenase